MTDQERIVRLEQALKRLLASMLGEMSPAHRALYQDLQAFVDAINTEQGT